MTDPRPPELPAPSTRSSEAGTRSVLIDGVTVGRGSRVRLAPSRGADIFDLALAGRIAEVDGVEEDFDGHVHVAVVLEGDPGRDVGASRGQVAHRFFFAPEELEPVASTTVDGQGSGPRVLVAGIGNIFCADDGFGPEVAAALRRCPLPANVHVVDFGIRGMDLAYRMSEGWDAVVLVDAAPRGERPGTLSVIEPDIGTADAAPEAHAMDPVRVLALARHLSPGPLPRVLVVGCEPETRMTGAEPDVRVGLSAPVRRAVADAVPLVRTLVAELGRHPDTPVGAGRGGRTGREVSPQ